MTMINSNHFLTPCPEPGCTGEVHGGKPLCVAHMPYAQQVARHVRAQADMRAERRERVRERARAERLANAAPVTRAEVAARLRDGRERAAQAGNLLNRPPYGYVRDDDGQAVPCPVAAEVLRGLFRGRAEGEGMTALARWAHDQDNSLRWSPQHVRLMLRNPVYLGLVVWRGEVYPGRHEALVSEREWAAVNGGAAPRARSA